MWNMKFGACILLYVYVFGSVTGNEWATETCEGGVCKINKNNDSASAQQNIQGTLSQDEEPKGRALNFTMDDHNVTNIIASTNNPVVEVPAKIITESLPKKKTKDLSDVSMDDDDDDIDTAQLITTELPKNSSTFKFPLSLNTTMCEDAGKKYMKGEKVEHGCDEMCECMEDGSFHCKPRCSMPFFRKGKQLHDPLCSEKPVDDPCCAIMVCASDTETEPLELCTFKNKTYHRGDTFNDECTSVCTCQHSGKVQCKPRCPPLTQKSSDACVTVPDPNDSCCQIVLCDVTLNDHDMFNKDASSEPSVKLTAENINQTTVRLSIEATNINTSIDSVEISEDRRLWRSQKLLPENLINGLEEGHMYYIKIGSYSNIVEVDIPGKKSPEQTEIKEDVKDGKCIYKGMEYNIGQEFHDECTAYCMCEKTGVICFKLECPTNFGLDVLDPHCLDWEPIPANFTPRAPHCCAEKVRCVRDGSCMHEGVKYHNFAEIPSNITGCHRRCYCEMGKVECQEACPPVTAKPPSDLPCLPQEATLTHRDDDDCCLYWLCNKNQAYPAFPNIPAHHPAFNQPKDEINILNLEALNENTIRLVFTVPPVLVGLHGRVELRYTSKQNDDPLSWNLQVFAPPNDLIATPQLEFELPGLEPDTEYKIKITIMLRDLHNTPTSRVYVVRTPPTKQTEVQTTLPSIIPIEPNLHVGEVNSTWLTIVWRKFTDDELQFIDGVQIRYKEVNGMVYAATPLIHRAVTSYALENLKPETEYEIGIFFIPFHGQQTELKSDKMLHVTTLQEIDMYGFNVTLEVRQVKSTSVEVYWSGVPYPEDKYVNIYRAIYQSEHGKEDFSTFKIAKRDSPAKTIIRDLKPATHYHLWLEVYLTNGRIKTSNVQEFMTKEGVPIPHDHTSQQVKSSGVTQVQEGHDGDYYGPLVVVAIIAALAILATLILLLVLVRRYGQHKAAITAPVPRVSQASYDNPTYKIELQQETMNL